jgi:TRAP-type uncharacterized transport system substrate-binding protein
MSPLQRIFVPNVTEKEAMPPPRGGKRARLSMMMRQTWFVTLLSIFLVMGTVGAAFYFSSRPTTLRFAVGPQGSEDARLVQALSQQFVRDRAPIRLVPVIDQGPADAARAIDTNQADLAVVRRDIGYPQTGQAIAVLRESVAAIIVPAAGSRATGDAKPQNGRAAKAKKLKPIENIEDLEGRRIGVVGPGPANVEVLNVVLAQYQIAKEKVTIVPLDSRDLAGSLRGNPVDVLFAVGPVASPVMADAIAVATNGKTEPTLLKIGAAEAIAARQPAFEATEIKSGVLGGQSPLPEEAVETISFKHYIVARRSLPENTAAEFTRLLFSARQGLGADHPVLAKLEKPDTDRDAAVSAHPGAAAFLDNEQKTFLDKYGDLVYLGLMLMSGLGSGAAWLASYARADLRMRRLKVLDRLLDIVKAARAAETVDELLKLRSEADEVLKQTITQVEQNKLDESALMAFSLALDQAQLAISDRRAALAGLPVPARSEAPTPPLKPLRKGGKMIPEPS